MRTFNVQFGIFAPPLRKQLSGLRIAKNDMEGFQKCADAIVQLYLSGVLSEAEKGRARDKLVKKIRDAIPQRKREKKEAA